MDKAQAERVLEEARSRRNKQAEYQRRYRQRKREREQEALRAVGHDDACTFKTCSQSCLVARFGAPPGGLDEGNEDPSSEH